jgi:hypothetical protein
MSGDKKYPAAIVDDLKRQMEAKIPQLLDQATKYDLKRQMEAKIPQLLDQATKCPKCEADIVLILPEVITCSKCNWFYVPLQVSNLFKKEEDK